MLHNNWCIIKLVLTVDSGENDVIPVKTNYISCKKYCDHSDIASLYLNSHNFISFASFCLLFYRVPSNTFGARVYIYIYILMKEKL